ncbi:hypothetical protein [Chitinophaga pinensis]|uniref:Uncharacterized protein n=1 Tax=Chitinophaga pinensis TaxID=79329 RepID=A0A5C6LME5_9BACT|nr:hypothetical protein [Chitinophaga pinensis]TWV95692.1 hypothetical protein FEF09_23960 [Chitinophaga pinensis]
MGKAGEVEFQYGAVYKSSGTDQLTFGPDLTVGALRSFELKDTGTAVQRYLYYDNTGTYRTTNWYCVPTGGRRRYDRRVIYPLQCDGKVRMYKFTRRVFRSIKKEIR